MSTNQKVLVASMHFHGRAQKWFKGFIKLKSNVTWEELAVEIMKRYPKLDPTDVVGEFNKLKQKGSVDDYLKQFEDLKVELELQYGDLQESYYMCSFYGGLKNEI